ncbi:Tissue-resident T-cell transcription regulator protein ZNF683 [Manis javanica]|nr:Tissue-resident T-cell transcription regulator protein ZNF683 [Manis javanica]
MQVCHETQIPGQEPSALEPTTCHQAQMVQLYSLAHPGRRPTAHRCSVRWVRGTLTPYTRFCSRLSPEEKMQEGSSKPSLQVPKQGLTLLHAHSSDGELKHSRRPPRQVCPAGPAESLPSSFFHLNSCSDVPDH